MKILFVCHRFPFPPNRGGKIRPFNMIRHLHDNGHEVTVVSMVRSSDELRGGEGISEYCSKYIVEQIGTAAATWRMVARLPTLQPSSFGYFHSPALRRRIQPLVRTGDYALIIAHCSSAAQYVENVHGVPKLLDFGDMDSQKWLIYSKFRKFPLAAGYGLEGWKLERREKQQASRFDYCTCTTRAEWETLNSYQTGTASGWFPNGVDTEYFAPGEESWNADEICFVGRMDYYPNQQGVISFCRDVLQEIRASRPSLTLTIVGANPSPEIRALEKLPGVRVTGTVPDVRPFVRRATLTIAPLQIARGTQNKILESMAMGTPVISSREAAGGVDAVPGEHILVAESPGQYREAMLRLLGDRHYREQVANAGRQRVLDKHNWPDAMRRMEALVEKCLSGWTDREPGWRRRHA